MIGLMSDKEKAAMYRNAADDLRSEVSTLRAQLEQERAKVAYLENSMKNAIGWIDGDLREIIRDVGNQICSYNDLYESADRIEELLAQALRQQADEAEKGGK